MTWLRTKSWPSRLGEAGRVDTTAAHNAVAPALLVRWADPAGQRSVAALLPDAVDSRQVADLLQHHGVLVLSDLTLPPAAPPFAAAAVRLHRPTGTAQLAGIGVRPDLHRRGLGRRLLTGALAWLRADGFEQVHAFAAPGEAGASLLASAGFTADHDSGQADDRSRFILLL